MTDILEKAWNQRTQFIREYHDHPVKLKIHPETRDNLLSLPNWFRYGQQSLTCDGLFGVPVEVDATVAIDEFKYE